MNLSIWKRKSKTKNSEFFNDILSTLDLEIDERDNFLNPDISTLSNPKELQSVKEAAALLDVWMKKGYKICIYGDYDCDGVCSSAILYKSFYHKSYKNIFCFLPNRFDHGYGLSKKTIDIVREKGADAIITVDCGISAVEEVKYAKELGLEIIITDHHNPKDELPDAEYVINPKISSKGADFYELAGAGVAFFLARELVNDMPDSLFRELLQLSSLATVCDLVPLTYDNRLIVKTGIQEIQKNPSKQIKTLMEKSSVKKEDFKASDFGFKLGPRVNAAGRMQDAMIAFDYFISDDEADLNALGTSLSEFNQRRTDKQTEIFDEAIKQTEIDEKTLKSGIVVVYSDKWHQGIIGIAASKIVEKLYRPCIVLTKDGENYKGSARSISKFSIYDAISSAEDLLISFGGHEQACGLSLEISKLDEFIDRLKEYCDEKLKKSLLTKSISYVRELDISEISFENTEKLESLRPFGIGNPSPKFMIEKFLVLSSQIIGKNKNTLKLCLEKENRLVEAIMFNVSDKLVKEGDIIDAIVEIKINTFRNVSKINLHLKAIRNYQEENSKFQNFLKGIYFSKLLSFILQKKDYKEYFESFKKTKKIHSRSEFWSIEQNSKIGVFSKFNFLSIMYYFLDTVDDMEELYEYDNFSNRVILYPDSPDDIDYIYGETDIIGIDFKTERRKQKDNFASSLSFNRNVFDKLYSSLKSKKKMTINQIFKEFSYSFTVIIAIRFFEESHFVELKENTVYFIDEIHQKKEYSKSEIYSSCKKLIDYLYDA